MYIRKNFKSNLKFGISGVQEFYNENIDSQIESVKKASLDHLEISFVKGINISEERGYKINHEAAVNKISLSLHGSYSVDLSGRNKSFVERSIDHLIKISRLGRALGVNSIVFHPGYYNLSKKKLLNQ